MEMPHWTAELEGGGSMPTVHHSSGRTATRRRAGPGRAHPPPRNTWEENGSSEDGGCSSGSGFTVATTVVAQMMGGPSFGAKFKGATAMTTKNDVGEMETMGSALICCMPAELRRNRRRHGVGAATKRRPRPKVLSFFLFFFLHDGDIGEVIRRPWCLECS